MRGLVLIITTVGILLNGCSRKEIKVENLNNGKVYIIGHAGVGFREFSYADNSYESIEKAIEGYGVDGVEMDIQLSKDSSLILFHNDNLESATSCSGCISEKETEELLDCKYRQNITIRIFSDQNLTTADKILSTYAQTGNGFFIFDLKDYPQCFSGHQYMDALAEKLAETVQKYGCAERSWAEVSNEYLARAIRTREPAIRLFWNCSDPDIHISKAVELGLDGIMARNPDISAAQVKRAHDANLWVCLFSVKTDHDTKKAIKKGPEMIISDNIPAAVKYLNR